MTLTDESLNRTLMLLRTALTSNNIMYQDGLKEKYRFICKMTWWCFKCKPILTASTLSSFSCESLLMRICSLSVLSTKWINPQLSFHVCQMWKEWMCLYLSCADTIYWVFLCVFMCNVVLSRVDWETKMITEMQLVLVVLYLCYMRL